MTQRWRVRVAGVALGLVGVALAGGTALAYFTTNGTGTVSAGVSSLTKPTISSATPAVGGTVTLTWAASTAPAAGTVTYYVSRDGGAPGGTCPTNSSPAAVTTCVDKEVEPGTHSYVVTAAWNTWRTEGAPASAKVTIGAATHFALTAASTAPVAGVADNLTITALDVSNAKVTTYTGSKNLVFSGASPGPAGTAPSVANSSGTPVAFGTTTAITFTSGAATVSTTKNGVMKIYRAGAANVSVSDGTISTSSPIAVTVSAAALLKLVLAVETTTPAVGAADDLTISAQDTYGNPIPTYEGAKSLTFSGASAGPNGTVPTVTDSTGEATAFGAATSVYFESGVATTSASLNGEMRLYKSGATSVKVTDGTLSSATVTVIPPAGAAVKLSLTAATSTPVAGASVNLTITALDTYGNTATTYTGSKSLTFSGASASPGGTAPTVTNASGTAVAFGTATPITFTSGAVTRALKIYRAGSASISATDGSLSAEPAIAVTVSAAALSKLVLAVETTTPAVGAADDLTVSAQDTYGNLVPTYTGSKSLAFSGASASPNGTVPTVTNSAGEAIAFGTAIPFNFEAGIASTSGSRNGEMRLYKSGATSIKVTDGTLTSATVTVTPPPGTASKFVLSASTLTPAAGASVNLTTTAQDTYGNTATAYAGSRGIVFSGAGTSAGGTAPTVVNAAGTAVAFGAETVLTFTSGVAAVASSKNGLFKPSKAEVAAIAAGDGTISTASALTVTVSATTASKLAFTHVASSAGSLGSPCYFTCTATALGNSGTIQAGVAVTDTYGNIVSNVGTGHSVTVTTTGGAVTGGAIAFPAIGPAESPADFVYTSPASGAFSNTVKVATSAGTVYANATITASK